MSIQPHPLITRCSPGAARGLAPLASGLEGQVTPYVSDVRESDEIDREQWARLLTRLLLEAHLSPEQAARPVGPVPAAPRTIRKWLTKEGGVGAAKVRDVARSLGYPVPRALVEVGFIGADEFGVTGLTAPPSRSTRDPLMRRIDASLAPESGVPEEVKGVLRQLLDAAYGSWLRMYAIGGGHEPPASKRTGRPARSEK